MYFNISCLEIIIPLDLSAFDMEQLKKMSEGSGPTKTKREAVLYVKDMNYNLDF